MKIVADDKIPFLRGVLEPFADVEYLPGSKISRAHLVDADALLVRTRTRCDHHLLEGTKVKFIATATIGYDHIDTSYCQSAGITWTNAPGCNAGSVMQWVTASILHLALTKGFSVRERTLGIVGVGNVGKKILSMAEALGMRVVLCDPPRERSEGHCGFVSLGGILREADIITFHVPLHREGVDKTYHLADEKFFSKVLPGTIVLNSSRGEVVHTGALTDALQSGRLAGAAIDVWEGEPAIDSGLHSIVDIGTPHIAGYSADGKANGTAMSVAALSRFFEIGIETWYPHEIPGPDHPVIQIDARGLTFDEVIARAVLHTYPIDDDHQRLWQAPLDFEAQRGGYPVRREFHNFTIELAHANKEVEYTLQKLGFKVSTI